MDIVLSAVLSFLAGGVLATRFMRRELAGILDASQVHLDRRLKHLEEQLQILRSEINLDAATRLAQLNKLIDDRRPKDR